MTRTTCDWRHVRRVHLLGICGTGMGTFAGLLRERGLTVTGSDENVYPPMSTMLADWGISVQRGYRAENLDPPPDLVVVGNVIRRSNPEATEVRRRGLPHTSFPDAFGALFLGGRDSIVVAGTHGKTSTTALLAWLLTAVGADPGFLVGGIPLNFGRSFALGVPPYFIVEGDEYDTAYFDKGPKLLHYRPRHAILTNVEFDHGDIYADLEAVKRAFEQFVALVPRDGSVTVCGEDPRAVTVAGRAACPVETYGFSPQHNWRVADLRLDRGGTRFTLHHDGQPAGEFTSPLYGRHNALNAASALAVALREGVPADDLARALARFQGVRKRQQVLGVADGVTVVDDFAHHPTAVRETILAVRQRFPRARLWAVFHPESNTSRRRLFQDDYPLAFRNADFAIIARALKKSDDLAPEEQIDVARVVDDIRTAGLTAHGDLDVDAIVDLLAHEARAGDVVLAMSGRDFEGLHERLLTALRAREAARR